MRAFSYRFWTGVWPKIGKENESDISDCSGTYPRMLIEEAMNRIEIRGKLLLHEPFAKEGASRIQAVHR